MEKLKDMEQSRMNEESERYVPKQVEMPDCDDDSDIEDSHMEEDHHVEIEAKQ
jgi:hypothetical protein